MLTCIFQRVDTEKKYRLYKICAELNIHQTQYVNCADKNVESWFELCVWCVETGF